MNKKNIDKLVGIFLRKKRNSLGLTGAEMGEKLNISQQQVSRYENEKSSASVGFILLFLNQFNIGVEEFCHYLLANISAKNDIECEIASHLTNLQSVI